MGALEYFKGFNIIDDLNSGMNLHIKWQKGTTSSLNIAQTLVIRNEGL
jgi:hypothetical protein